MACEFEAIQLPNGEIRQVIKKVKYPELYSWVMNLGPLDSSTWYDKAQANRIYYRTKNEIRKHKAKYRRKPEVVDAFNKVHLTKFRQIFGDSEMGKKQGFLARIYGAVRRVELSREDRKGGLRGALGK